MIRLVPLYSGVLLLATATTAYCFDSGRSSLQLLANDKDVRSILVGKGEVKEADQVLGGINASKDRLDKVAQALADSLFNSEEEVCEPQTLKFLAQTNQANSLPSDANGIKAVLTALRSQNAIDDLVLLPLLKALPAYEEYQKAPIADERGNCPSVDYIERYTRLNQTLGKKFKRGALLNEIQTEGERQHLSAYQEKWLLLLYQYNWDKVPFTLSKVVRGIQALKNTELKEEKISTPTDFSSNIVKKTGGLTARMKLYKKYDSSQIQILSNIQRDFMRRKYPTNKYEFRITHEDGTFEAKAVTAVDKQYRLVAAWYYSDIQEAQHGGDLFLGVQIDTDDVVAAGLETGAVSGSQVNFVLAIPEMWDPKVSKWQKILTAVQKYGGPALMFAPPPFNILASTALTLLQTKIFQKDKTGADPDNLLASPF